MIAVVPVRDGLLAAGAEETLAESGGVGLLVGGGVMAAAERLADRVVESRAAGECHELRLLEIGPAFRPARWARELAPHLRDDPVVVLPASPDGRDLAPRLAAELDRPLVCNAIAVTHTGATVVAMQGRQLRRVLTAGPFVVTLLPGSRTFIAGAAGNDDDAGGREPRAGAADGNGPGDPPGSLTARAPLGPGGGAEAARPMMTELASGLGEDGPAVESSPEAELLGILAADPDVMDLAEAGRIVAAGAGAGGPEAVAELRSVASALGASLGATRVVTDAGWLGHDRQIGTTGVAVHPRCYVAFGVSGAAQHLGGLGTPRRVVSVNLDPSCPMSAMADLALVADAPGVIAALARRLAGSGAS